VNVASNWSTFVAFSTENLKLSCAIEHVAASGFAQADSFDLHFADTAY